MMITAAVVAAVMATRAEITRCEDRRRRYEILADLYSDNPFQEWADLTHEQFLARCREIDEENRKGPRMLGSILLHPPEPAVARRASDRHVQFRKQCEWNYAHPWWTIEPGPPPP